MDRAQKKQSRKPVSKRPPPLDLVSRLQRAEESFTPSEHRLADVVCSNFEATTRMTIAELARRANVSQPTVTRFCRSVGCRSFADFKINLAATLTVASVYLKRESDDNSDAGDMAHTIVLRAVNALQSCLDQLSSSDLSDAISALANARRIDIYGQGGGSSAMVEDSKLRFFRLGIPIGAYIDGHQQRMSAATLRPGDVALAISNSGKSKPVVEAIDIARSFGAQTIAITRPETPLAEAAEKVIAVVIAESENVLLPTPSRYAHLAVIDTLAAGVALKLGDKSRESLRRVRYTLARIGVAIPTPSTDPSPIMSGQDLEE
jgi:RpiR family transcriptional regulator, carbohydrate utilization regulator